MSRARRIVDRVQRAVTEASGRNKQPWGISRSVMARTMHKKRFANKGVKGLASIGMGNYK